MKHLLLIAALLPCQITFASDAPALGLGERRAMKEYQESKLPALQEALKAAAGKDVEIQVDWDKIAVVGQASRYVEDGYWTNIYFVPTIDALKSLTKDEMGKEAVGAKLKKIVFTYDDATAPLSNYPEGVCFEEGVLTINFRPGVNESDAHLRTDAIVATMEPKL